MDGIDVDATLEAIGTASGDSNIPMSTPAPAVEPTPTQQEIEFNWKGRQIKAPLDKAQQWMSQGYDYGQRVSELKAEREAFLAEQQEHKGKYSRYEEVDAYAKQDPAWWQHVEETWAQRQARQQSQTDDPNDPVALIKSELEELKQFRSEILNDRKQAAVKEQDSKLNEEISGLQKMHSDLDWTGVDESGLTLEMRVLQHAQQNGISSFRAAFRDMNHEQLMTMTASKAREEAVRKRQADAKAGIVGRSNTPVKGVMPAQNVKNKSYSELLREGIAELGL